MSTKIKSQTRRILVSIVAVIMIFGFGLTKIVTAMTTEEWLRHKGIDEFTAEEWEAMSEQQRHDYLNGYDDDDDDDDDDNEYDDEWEYYFGDNDDDDDDDYGNDGPVYDNEVYDDGLTPNVPTYTSEPYTALNPNEAANLSTNYWGTYINEINNKYPNTERYSVEYVDPRTDVKKYMNPGSNPLLPYRSTAGSSGMFPQYFGASSGTGVRTIQLPDDRGELKTAEWATVTNGDVVFCSAYHYAVRYGKWDPTRYYFDTSTGIKLLNESATDVSSTLESRTYNEIETILYTHLQQYYSKGYNDAHKYWSLRDYYGGEEFEDGVSSRSAARHTGNDYHRIRKYTRALWPDNVTITIDSTVPGNLKNSICYPIITSSDIPGKDTEGTSLSFVYNSTGEAVAASQAKAQTYTQSLFNAMNTGVTGKDVSPSIDVTGGAWAPNPTGTQGPTVVVLENSPHASDGYKLGEKKKFENDAKAYIFSSEDNDYDVKNNYASKYTLNDIQGAYWKILTREGGIEPTNHVTANARVLYEKALEYEKFVNDLKDGYKSSIDNSQAQVIADRANKKYIVGPYKLNYMQYDKNLDLSYVKAIYLETDKGEMIYDEKHNDIQVVMDGTGTIGANGLTKEYPKNGQSFFVVFDAEKAGFPTEVTLNAKFEYIKEAYASGQNLTSTAKGYSYDGHSLIGGDSRYQMDKYSMTITITSTQGFSYRDEYDCGGDSCNGHKYTYYYNNYDVPVHTITLDVYFPYIQMYENAEWDKTAQTLTVTGYGESKPVKVPATEPDATGAPVREKDYGRPNIYRIYSYSKAQVKIDLTMELGGYAWFDEDGGKESISDGLFKNEKRIPNMKVTLESVNANNAKGTATQTATTDTKGEYRFKGLNAMFQYKIKFHYNAQYYEPTTWQPASTWGTANWNINSNAKDNVQEREQYNLGFKVIGAKRGTYAENVSSSSDDVAITSIGSVSQSGDNKSYTRAELKAAGAIDEFGLPTGSGDSSMQHYVEDCMLDAYTCGDKSNNNPDGLYPYPSLFVIDKNPVTREYMRCFNHEPSRLYDSAYYINLGLSDRQQSDIAVKKDVDHVTLEINGQSHTYKYDSLETKINEDSSWTVGVRTSDAFKSNYGTSYVRELYKSDYLYKASNYGDVANTLGKAKADELEVFITYKIMVRNQSLSIRTRVDELVDYYDEDLQYIDERSYIEVKQSRDNSAQKGIYPVKADYDPATENSNSYYATDSIPGYKNLYVRGLGQLNADKNSLENYLAAGQTAYVYLTFRVKKDTMDGEDWVKLDEEIQSGNPIGVGKENIAEINGYSTQYAKGTKVPNKGDVSFEPAGILDRDSSSGNAVEAINHKDVPADSNELNKLEDDTGKAPNIRIILYRDDSQNRVIAGNIFEDLRTQSIDLTTTGDGLKDASKEPSINGVTVQLVEIMENGQEYVWREFGDNAEKTAGIGGVNTIGKGTGSGTVLEETPIINKYNLVANYKFAENHDGDYAFKSFMPGKYVIRYIYGDTVRTVVPKSLGGLNEKSYNGQDYKSTTYQKGIDQNLNVPSRDQNTWVNTASNLVYIWREDSTWAMGQETLGRTLTQVATIKEGASNNERVTLPNGTDMIDVNAQNGYLYDITASDANANVSDAKDIESRRNVVNNYSSNGVTNYIAEVLASHKADYTPMNDRGTLLNDLMANTQMTAETGLMVIDLEYDTEATAFEQPENGKYTTTEQGKFNILNVNLGLEERPKAQIAIDKKIANVKVIRADGATLFDASDSAQNITWRKHQDYNLGYKGNVLDPDKFGNIENIRNKNSNKFGLVQPTMDEELMHGATIQITYTVKVTNVGEVDYYNNYGGNIIQDRLFYYTGVKSSNAQVVTTRVDQVLDYVANNLQFNVSSNGNWHTIEQEKIKTDGLVNRKLNEALENYNTIISTEQLNKELKPVLADKNNSSTSVPLVLTQLITAENDTDDLTYRNIVEIVKTSNTVGRRMEYSVVGNQNPTEKPAELDSDMAETVRILPPFGSVITPYIIVAIIVGAVALLVVGIIFIKKKVLNNK